MTGKYGAAAEWPPALDKDNPTAETKNGRKIERYTHGPRPEWGYPDHSPNEWRYPDPQESNREGQNHNSFYVVSPRKPHKKAPLCVVLHSANRTAFDYLGYEFLDRKIEPTDDPSALMTRAEDSCYVLFLNSTNDEWWGWATARREITKYQSTLTPAEKRVLDTIEWVIKQYGINRNRVYLSGISMGGCGTLAIGLPHGDIFASILVDVPAGTEYAALRMRFRPPQTLAGLGLPDPPVVVDFSAENDKWSKTQPELLQAANVGKLPLVLAWGPFGHTAFSTSIAKYPEDEVALSFPWMEIRKNEAYPVFTNASSDQHSPWTGDSTHYDESGQVNAYFRWSIRQDKTSKFRMRLWLAHPLVRNAQLAMPDVSTTEITLRRLQSFKVRQGKVYFWRLVCGRKVISSGRVTPDAANLLTIPRVPVSVHPAELILGDEE
jgi:poly(3-hydroxybutyrate) depolymerase